MDKNISKQYKQKAVIEEFVASVNLFISEYYIETLEQNLTITEIYLNNCQSWTIDEKDVVLKKLYDLEAALMERIEVLNPEILVGLND